MFVKGVFRKLLIFVFSFANLYASHTSLLFAIIDHLQCSNKTHLQHFQFIKKIIYSCSAISQYQRFDLWAIIINHVCPSPVAASRLGYVPDDLEMNYVP